MPNQKPLTGLFLMVCLLIAIPCQAFEKDAHRQISLRAVELFAKHYTEKSVTAKDFTESFVSGSEAEDDITISMQRLINWHFFDPGNRLGRTWWGAYKSNDHRFATLTDKLAATNKDDRLAVYELVGRLAHHIQDMRSPPHAVPVFHTSEDTFDSYATSRIHTFAPTDAQISAAMSMPVRIDFTSLDALRKTAARQTRQQVDSPVIYKGGLLAANWWEFWRNYEQVGLECGKEASADFGCYGKSVYGIETGNFTPEIYAWLYQYQVNGAIVDSLRLLIALSE